jgi:branched-chain amino acid transport system substrate-binding protein
MKFRHLVIVAAAFLLIVPTMVPAADEIKIGFHSPTTGWAAADGLSALRGAQLAVEYINGKGGINGKKIELVYYDDRVEAKESVIVARKLIEKDGVVGVVSGSYSTPTRAAAPIYNQAKIPYISTIGTHPEIPIGRPYVFQLAVMSPIHGRVGAKASVDILKAKTAVTLIMDNDFGRAVVSGFQELAPKLGIKILNEYVYPLGEKDFRSILSNVKKDNPDIIRASGYYEEAARFLKQAREMGIKATFVGDEGYDSPKFFELGGDAVEGVVITTNLDRGSNRPMTQWFLNEYPKKFTDQADMVAASAFDGILVLSHAIGQGGTDPDRIGAAISQIKNFESSVTGPFLFFDKERTVCRPIPVQIVKDKAWKPLWLCTDLNLITP